MCILTHQQQPRNVTAAWPRKVPPTVPMNLGTGKKTEPADPKQWGLQTDSKQMRNHSCYQQFPACNLGKMSNKLELQTKCQQFPLWSLGTNQPLSFSTQVRELWSEQRARGLGSGWTHLLAQAELPWIGTPITSTWGLCVHAHHGLGSPACFQVAAGGPLGR